MRDEGDMLTPRPTSRKLIVGVLVTLVLVYVLLTAALVLFS